VVCIPTFICMWNMEPHSPWKEGAVVVVKEMVQSQSLDLCRELLDFVEVNDQKRT